MPAIFDYPHTVEEHEIDALGHASNMVYLAWMQAAAIAHSAAQGWPIEAYQRIGAGWVVRSHQIEYLRPALAGDELIVRTWVASFRKVSSVRRYQMLRPRDGRLLATAATDWVFVKYATLTPARVPPELLGAFELVESEPPLPER